MVVAGRAATREGRLLAWANEMEATIASQVCLCPGPSPVGRHTFRLCHFFKRTSRSEGPAARMSRCSDGHACCASEERAAGRADGAGSNAGGGCTGAAGAGRACAAAGAAESGAPRSAALLYKVRCCRSRPLLMRRYDPYVRRACELRCCYRHGRWTVVSMSRYILHTCEEQALLEPVSDVHAILRPWRYALACLAAT